MILAIWFQISISYFVNDWVFIESLRNIEPQSDIVFAFMSCWKIPHTKSYYREQQVQDSLKFIKLEKEMKVEMEKILYFACTA